MLDLPPPVLDYISTLTIENRSPAYLLVRKDGRLSDCGGKLAAYGITGLKKGDYAEKQLFFLEGLLPLTASPIFFRCIKTESGLFADIHIFPADQGYWVLLLDATSDEIRRSLMQQKVNDLSLLRDKQSRMLSRYLGKDMDENLVQEIATFKEAGERRDLTILFADIRGFTPYCEKNPPEEVFKTLDLYTRAMIQPILNEAGMVDKIIGDALMALFGLLHSTGSPPNQALEAALRMIEAVADINKMRQLEGSATFEIGIGIASGLATVGLHDGRGQRSFNVIGEQVNLAARLERQARPNEILIDENSFREIGVSQERFSAITLLLEETAEPVRAFYCLVK